MWINLKIKTRWPLSMFFKSKESEFEILPELTADEKALKKELFKMENSRRIQEKLIRRKEENNRNNTARSIRG